MVDARKPAPAPQRMFMAIAVAAMCLVIAAMALNAVAHQHAVRLNVLKAVAHVMLLAFVAVRWLGWNVPTWAVRSVAVATAISWLAFLAVELLG